MAAGDVVERCARDPALLREEAVVRDLREVPRDTLEPVMAAIAGDDAQPWDVRAAALGLAPAVRHREVWSAFGAAFEPLEVAATAEGAAAFNILAAATPRFGLEHRLLAAMILPGEDLAGVAAVLEVLGGRPLSPYLHLLVRKDYQFGADSLTGVADTDDEDTRRFVAWYIGEHRVQGMESLLVDLITAPRTSTYPSQARRLLEFALTGGISELFQPFVSRPPWTEPDMAPKGLALDALAVLRPPRASLDREVISRLLVVARTTAGGEDRGQWQLAADIVGFLLERGVSLGPEEADIVETMVRQALRRNGPLLPFAVAARACQRGPVPWPRLDDDERTALWDIAFTTFEAPFLAALVRAVPDPQRAAELERHLLGLAESAARGTLRRSRCMACAIEGPGDWSRAVAELGYEAALPAVERALFIGWDEDDTVAALVTYGPPGVPALARFLVTARAESVAEELLVEAVGLCLRTLPAAEGEALAAALRRRRVTERVLRAVEGGR